MDFDNIGAKIKKLRKERGLTQSNLAEKLGITYQQIQKYESGKSQISINKLKNICKALEVPMSFFFSTKLYNVADPSTDNGYKTKNTLVSPLTDEEKNLLNLFRKIKSEEIKKSLLSQIKGILKF